MLEEENKYDRAIKLVTMLITDRHIVNKNEIITALHDGMAYEDAYMVMKNKTSIQLGEGVEFQLGFTLRVGKDEIVVPFIAVPKKQYEELVKLNTTVIEEDKD